MAFKFYNNFFVLLFVFAGVFGEFPEDIEKCNYGNVECIKKVAAVVLKKYPHGLESLRIPDLEPFHLDNATFPRAVPLNIEYFDVKTKTTNVDIYGLSKIIFEKFVGFDKDPAKSKFEFYGRVPNIKLKAKYSIKGRVFGLPIDGEGPLEVEMGDVSVSIKIKLKIIEKKNNKTYMKVDKYKTLVDTKSFKLNVKNLFGDDQILSQSMNELFNQNWKIIWDEAKTHIGEIVGKFAYDILNDLFTTLPYEDLFLPD